MRAFDVWMIVCYVFAFSALIAMSIASLIDVWLGPHMQKLCAEGALCLIELSVSWKAVFATILLLYLTVGSLYPAVVELDTGYSENLLSVPCLSSMHEHKAFFARFLTS